MEKLKEIFNDIFELLDNLIWMLNMDSSHNVQERLKELGIIKKKVSKLTFIKEKKK